MVNGNDLTIRYVQIGPNKGRPICSLCNRVGHIVERYYKKHGFPPGFTLNGKIGDKFQKSKLVAANVALATTNSDDAHSSLENMVVHLSKEQLQQFIAMFSSQLHTQPQSNSSMASTSQSDKYWYFFFTLHLLYSQCSSSSHVSISGATLSLGRLCFNSCVSHQ